MRRKLAAGVFAVLMVASGCGREPELRHVVLVSLDAVGAGHVGAYGYARDTTPNLDAIAEAGVLFEAAFTQQPWTLSSHLTMLTGLDPAVHGATRERAASPAATTLAEALGAQGFASAAFVAERVWMDPRYGHARGFGSYEIGGSDSRANQPAIAAWLREQADAVARDAEHRFFLFAHFYDAHSDVKTSIPYSVPPPMRDRYLPDGDPWPHRGGTALLLRLRRSGSVTPRDREFVRAYYDAGVRYVDQYGLGAVVAALRELDLERDTLLIVTADHGEEIFEHGYVLHGQPYAETTRVPLVMSGPGIPRGLRLRHLVGVVDVAPTILGLLRLPPLPGAQGLDYSDCLNGADPPRDAVFTDGMYQAAEGWGSSVVADVDGERWSYIARVRAEGARGARRFAVEGDGELYHLGRDPGQESDERAQSPRIAAQLRDRLLGWYRANDLRSLRIAPARAREPLALEEREHLRALGYAD